jgi:hypothetical protein
MDEITLQLNLIKSGYKNFVFLEFKKKIYAVPIDENFEQTKDPVLTGSFKGQV